ncbi:hypothetical protein HDU67_008242 [Dinochytrium kinnereticum]|nr:hypothetical protein HDU67_008242 [Dinochytrium kinnereticum]
MHLISIATIAVAAVVANAQQCNFANGLTGGCQERVDCLKSNNVPTAGYCPGAASYQCCITKPKLSSFTFVNPTPMGLKLFDKSLEWRSLQLQPANIPRYPQKSRCADNLSQVMVEMAGMSPSYSDLAVAYMKSGIRNAMTQDERNTWIANIPLGSKKEAVINKLNQYFNGYIPLGTVIAGCMYADCLGEGGDAHIGFVGDLINVERQPNGKLKSAIYMIYHNNWLRTNNRNQDLPFGLGKLNKYMVDAPMFNSGQLVRQWMATPWLKVSWEGDKVVDVVSVLPELDDMDPLNGGYLISLLCPKEICSLLPAGANSRNVQFKQ